MAAAPIHNMAMFILSITVQHGDEQCHLTIDSLATSWQPLRIPSPIHLPFNFNLIQLIVFVPNVATIPSPTLRSTQATIINLGQPSLISSLTSLATHIVFVPNVATIPSPTLRSTQATIINLG